LATFAGSVTGGTTAYLEDTGKAWTPNEWKGLSVQLYDTSAGVTRRFIVASNTATRLYPYTSFPEAPAPGDGYVIGGVPAFLDLMIGDGITEQKLLWAQMSGNSDSDQNLVRVTVLPNSPTRAVNTSGQIDFVEFWPMADSYKVIALGGVGRTFRIRLSESGVLTPIGVDPVPSLTGRLAIHNVRFSGTAFTTR
jgi:hypothetical protein